MPERSKRDVQDLLKALSINCEIDDEVFELVASTNPTIKAYRGGEITFQEALFIEYYLSNGFRAGRAAEAANYSGLSAGAYGTVGRSVLKKPAIRDILSRRIAAKALTSDEILAEWSEIAKADMTDFMTVREREDPNTGAIYSMVMPDLAKAERLTML